jgi:hypothetical protein
MQTTTATTTTTTTATTATTPAAVNLDLIIESLNNNGYRAQPLWYIRINDKDYPIIEFTTDGSVVVQMYDEGVMVKFFAIIFSEVFKLKKTNSWVDYCVDKFAKIANEPKSVP